MPDSSTGTFTFLFTDLQGFTRLLDEHPETAQAALAFYTEVTRRAIGNAGGDLFMIAGDGFAAAFVSAPDALSAAVEVQRALVSRAWPGVGVLRVRMGLHTGEALHREATYLGVAVNVSGRLGNAAHGGQILVSRATQELVRNSLPHGTTLRDLGEHPFKDVTPRIRVFQLVAPDLPSRFPPLRTLDRLETTRRLRAISREILTLLDRPAILSRLTSELPVVFPAKGVTVFLLDPIEGVYSPTGGERDVPGLSPRDSLLIRGLHESSRPITTYEIEEGPPDAALAPSDWTLAQRLGAVLWVPMVLWGRLVGALALGWKSTHEPYTEEEIDALCLIANEAAVALENATLAAAREQQARLQQELGIARAIQTSLLPSPRLSLEGFEILSRSEPSTEVGGDFYNLFELPAAGEQGRRLGIVVGDVAGKGVPAALFMAVTTTLIRAQARLLESPAATLVAANAELHPLMRPAGGEQRLFATAVYGVLDLQRGEVRLASAGQIPAIYWPAGGEPRYVRATGLPLGARPSATYVETVLQLAPGDRLVLCSDGFIEQTGADGGPVGYGGFLRQLCALSACSDPELIAALFEDSEVSRPSADGPERDDRTLVLVAARQS